MTLAQGKSLILKHAKHVLQNQRALVKTVTESDYTRPLPFFGATIGQHVRHSLQHFEKLATDQNSLADYDSRSREVDLELSRAAALQGIDALLAALPKQGERLADKVDVKFMGDSSGNKYTIPSTLARELSFTAHHATHHTATIKQMMKSLDYEVDDNIGKANSTIQNENEA